MNEDAALIEQTLNACAAGSQLDCESFFRLIHPVFARVARGIAMQYSAEADIEDIVQEVSMRVATDPAAFALKVPSGKALSYFAVVAANAARDWFRARGAIKRGRNQTGQLRDDIQFSDGTRILQQERSVLLDQIERSLPPPCREKTIFHLYFQQGYTAREIAAIPAFGLNTKGVESLILRLVQQLREKLNSGEGSSPREASNR